MKYWMYLKVFSTNCPGVLPRSSVHTERYLPVGSQRSSSCLHWLVLTRILLRLVVLRRDAVWSSRTGIKSPRRRVAALPSAPPGFCPQCRCRPRPPSSRSPRPGRAPERVGVTCLTHATPTLWTPPLVRLYWGGYIFKVAHVGFVPCFNLDQEVVFHVLVLQEQRQTVEGTSCCVVAICVDQTKWLNKKP